MAEMAAPTTNTLNIPLAVTQGRAATLSEQISDAEQALLLANFAILKERATSGRDGELRVAVRRDPATGIVEVTYCGTSDKADLASLRQMYAQLRQKGTRF